MWPWEHLAVGYLAYSLGLRALRREPPSDTEALALALATQLPDLVDKPLSWGAGWFPSGHAVGHAALVAVPVGVAALWRLRGTDRARLAVAGVVGWWGHVLADVLDPLRRGDPPAPGRALWPLSNPAPYESDLGLGRGVVYGRRLLADLSTVDPVPVALYLLLAASTVAVWVADGHPGTGVVRRATAVLRAEE